MFINKMVQVNKIKGLEEVSSDYFVTIEGYIISFKKDEKGRRLKGYKNTKGYLLVDFSRNIRAKKIHRIAALTFIPNPKKLPQVNHKDGNKQNNNVDNLEWCDNSQNQIHAIKNNLRKVNKGNECYQYNKEHAGNKKVVQYDFNGKYIKEYFSIAMACRAVGGKTYSNISRACRTNGTAYGFKWGFK